jgi:putative hemolysin
MINIEETVTTKFPAFAHQPEIIRKPTLSVLRKLSAEQKINRILSLTEASKGFEFIDSLFNYFNCEFNINEGDLNKIPNEGALIVIANHPTGSLDGLALLNLIGKVRRDIKIVADHVLMNFNALSELTISATEIESVGTDKVREALKNQEAVIIFPAKDVSRASPAGIKDRRWSVDFLSLSREIKAPVLPIMLNAKNSILFYCISFLFNSFSRILLTNELTKKRANNVSFSIGQEIPASKLSNHKLKDKHLVKRIKKHIYKLSKNPHYTFITEKPIAYPQKTQHIIKDLTAAKVLGTTRDKNTIYLAKYRKKSALIKEIGRLREFTFRKVGEGTGYSRDLDDYDKHYYHLTLWQNQEQKIVGAYRIGEAGVLIDKLGINSLYTASLYQYSDQIMPYLKNSLELGRSFVHPDYWGKQSLDYLWQGIGAFIKHNPSIRYLIGPVSMSADFPRPLINELVFYFEYYYGNNEGLARAYNPYTLSVKERYLFQREYSGLDRHQAMDKLQKSFKDKNLKMPVLFKQYTSLYEEGGIKLLAFSVDPDFGDCIDGLLIADLEKLKQKKRERYIEGK